MSDQIRDDFDSTDGRLYVVNSIDLRGTSHMLPNWLASLGPLEMYHTLVAVRSTSHYGASGQYLAQLEDFRSNPTLIRQAAAAMPQFFPITLPEPKSVTSLQSSLLPFEDIVGIISHAQGQVFEYVASQASEVDLVAQIRRLLRRLDRKLLLTRKIVHRSISRFCGLSWSRRLWYLLHGSHPPKSECCPAFGCA